jgi:hypothetical protein
LKPDAAPPGKILNKINKKEFSLALQLI